MGKLNPSEWLSAENEKGQHQGAKNDTYSGNDREAVERALEAIEDSGIDLTAKYPDWVSLGFALADRFGELGREYFHRLSQFHSDYRSAECDRQYDRCVSSKGSGVTLATFFHHVKQAGISLAPTTPLQGPAPSEGLPSAPLEGAGSSSEAPKEVSEFAVEDQKKLPVFPEWIYPALPPFLQQVVAPADSDIERDVLLMGSLVVLSAAIPKLFGIYDRNRVGANLYLFVTAPASAGKGQLGLCKKLILPLHRLRRQEAKESKAEYEQQNAAFNAGKSAEKPAGPREKMLLIPANNSTTGIFQLLGDNDGQGLIFETEADSMTNAFRSDFGNYCDGFRKAFHHETISYFRRTEKEYVDIEAPCLSTLLTGTPRQVSALMPSTENGLFSRFLFYYMDLEPVWKDVFQDDDQTGAQQHFDNLGAEFFNFHQRLAARQQDIRFVLTPGQKQQFFDFFSQAQLRYLAIMSDDYVATVRRMGLICFRMAMLLSSLRLIDSKTLPGRIECRDEDFAIVMALVAALIKHSSYVYHCLPEERGVEMRSSRQQQFLEALPPKFDRRGYLQIAERMKIKAKTSEKMVTRFIAAKLVNRIKQGHFELNVKDKPDLESLL